MARNLENINAQRVRNGLSPLDKLPDAPPAAGGGKEDEEKPSDPPTPPTPEPPLASDDDETEIEDEKLIKALQKKGIVLKTIDDLKIPPDPVKLAEQKDADQLSYSLSKGLFSVKEHENYIREKNNPRDLVFAAYYDEAKQEDPTATDEDIQAEFEEKYGCNANESTFKFKRGVQEIGLLADKILKDKYKNIFSATTSYAKYEADQTSKRQRDATILAKAPLYKKDVLSAIDKLKTIKLSVDADESYEVAVPETALESLKQLFLEPETAASQIMQGYTAEDLHNIAYTALLKEHLPSLFSEGAKQYHLKRQKGAKGIPPQGPGARQATRVLTENQRKVLVDNGIREEDLPPVIQN